VDVAGHIYQFAQRQAAEFVDDGFEDRQGNILT
jgi:hypothetical protein